MTRPTKIEEIRRDNRVRAQKAAGQVSVAGTGGHTVDPTDSGLAKLREMRAKHCAQKVIEKEIRYMAAALETSGEVETFWRALVDIPGIDLIAMAECVPVRLRYRLPQHVQDAIGERVRARLGLGH